MIIKKLLDFLDTELTATVCVEVPETLSDYVLIDQTGSSRTNHIITTTFAIQSCGSTLYNAILLNETVQGVMAEFEREADIIKVELETDYNFTNTVTKQYRWQAVYRIIHY